MSDSSSDDGASGKLRGGKRYRQKDGAPVKIQNEEPKQEQRKRKARAGQSSAGYLDDDHYRTYNLRSRRKDVVYPPSTMEDEYKESDDYGPSSTDVCGTSSSAVFASTSTDLRGTLSTAQLASSSSPQWGLSSMYEHKQDPFIAPIYNLRRDEPAYNLRSSGRLQRSPKWYQCENQGRISEHMMEVEDVSAPQSQGDSQCSGIEKVAVTIFSRSGPEGDEGGSSSDEFELDPQNVAWSLYRDQRSYPEFSLSEETISGHSIAPLHSGQPQGPPLRMTQSVEEILGDPDNRLTRRLTGLSLVKKNQGKK